jgi:AcrR family transcriptional regulator
MNSENPSAAPRRRGRPPSGGRDAIVEAALKLLRERGIARVTTREVASLAGVSEASVFYHYTDRAGLLKAVFEAGVRPLQELSERGPSGSTLREVLDELGPVIERFLAQALPVLAAAQSDVDLRNELGAFMAENDLGPHRAVQALGDYLAERQAAGHVRSDIDPRAVALTFVGACFIRASQRQMALHENELPSLDQVITALETMLAPY